MNLYPSAPAPPLTGLHAHASDRAVRTHLFLVLPLMLAAQTLCAQDAMEDPFADDSLFMDVPSVFDASKNEQKVSQAPVWVSVVTAEEIRQYGYRTLAEILGSIPSFYTDYDRTFHTLGVRGFARPDDYSTRLLILLDGVRTNDGGLLDTAAIGRESMFDVNLIDRVEVSRGPGSSLYGSNAISAVVNVITKRGRDVESTAISVAAASNDTREYRATSGRRLDNGVEYLVSASRYDSGGNQTLFYPELDDPFFINSNGGVVTGVDGEIDENVSLKIGLSEFTLSAAFSQRNKVLPTSAEGTRVNDPGTAVEDSQQFLNLHHEHVFGTDVAWSGDLYWQRYDFHGRYRYDNVDFETGEPFPDEPPAFSFNNTYDNEWWGAQGQLTFYHFNRHKLIVGADFRSNEKVLRDQYDDFGPVFYDDRSTGNWGLYLQDEFRLRDNLQLLGGLRYDRFRDSVEDLSPRLGLVYSASDNTTLKLLYSTAFRAPNAFDMFSRDEDGGVIQNDLKSEAIDTYDIVWEQELGSGLRFVANPFYYRLEDLIEYGFDEETFSAFVINGSGHVESHGIDLVLEGKSSSGLKGQIGYTYQDTTDETGQRLLNSPAQLAKFGLAVPLWREGYFLGVDTRYLGQRRSFRGTLLGGHATTNVTFSATRLWDALDLTAGVYNVFDKRHGSPISAFSVQDVIEHDGRTYRVELEYRF